MTVHPIRITGDPVLHTPASPVTTFDSELHALVQDLVDTMHAAPGVGLAAPQIGVGLQVFVWEWEDDDGVLHAGSIVNPKMTTARRKRGKLDPDADAEGCLSAPDLRYPTRRSHSVVLQGFTPDQVPFHQEASGWLARIFQHEFDHLRGTLYLDRLSFRAKMQARREIRDAGWASPGLSWMPGVDDFEGSHHDAEEA